MALDHAAPEPKECGSTSGVNAPIPGLRFDRVVCDDEASWLAERRKRVQASEAAAIMGQSAWGSAYSIWTEKTLPAPAIDRERFTIGHELEAPIRSMYRKKFGGAVHEWPKYTIAVSREHSWLGCTPDGTVEDPSRSGLGLLEIKTASEFSKADWQESIPLAYQIQVQACLAVLGLDWAIVAVLIGVTSIERYFVERSERFIEAMLAVLADFATCIELRTPPAIDGSRATANALARLHPNDSGQAVRLPDGTDALLAKLRRVRSLAKRCDERKTAIENELKAAIGDNTYGETPKGHWLSWKTTERKSHTVAASSYRVLRECKEPHQIEYVDGSGATGMDYKVADRVTLPSWFKTKLLHDNPRCRWCGCQLTQHTATIDHIHPLSLGGTNDITNLDLACQPCNASRGNVAGALEAQRV